MERTRTYAAIDLKSFYASVECVERGVDPLTTNLVVADSSRTEKTICLAVSPSLKAHGIPGRPRLFEVVQKARTEHLEYIVAVPRMALYIQYSTIIYNVYLKYIAPEDIHVYSIDEVFLDVTAYLDTYHMTAAELVSKMIRDVYETTGITATGGVGTNLYLCKVAMDILAKHAMPDEHGVRIAFLDEEQYRRRLWDHKPLTDFWRVGGGISRKLQENGLFTMGDIARCSLGGPLDFYNEELLYRLFGLNAELLIDHAWGIETCTMEDIKAYQPADHSISQGQVLQCPYDYAGARVIVREMTEALSLDLVEKGLITGQLVLTVGYEAIKDQHSKAQITGESRQDHYGRSVPKSAHGSTHLERDTASTELLTEAMLQLYDTIVDRRLLCRRIGVAAVNVKKESEAKESYEQMNLFSFLESEKSAEQEERLARERSMQEAVLDIKRRFGKNAILRGTDLQEGATTIARNNQIGGHKA